MSSELAGHAFTGDNFCVTNTCSFGTQSLSQDNEYIYTRYPD